MKRLKAEVGQLKLKGQTLSGTVTDAQYAEAVAASPKFAEYFEDVPEVKEDKGTKKLEPK